MRPIVAACFSVNHTAPSGPAVRSRMLPVDTGTGYSIAFIVDAAAVRLGIPRPIATDRPASNASVVGRRSNLVTSFTDRICGVDGPHAHRFLLRVAIICRNAPNGAIRDSASSPSTPPQRLAVVAPRDGRQSTTAQEG